jgi:hypothetical protein
VGVLSLCQSYMSRVLAEHSNPHPGQAVLIICCRHIVSVLVLQGVRWACSYRITWC